MVDFPARPRHFLAWTCCSAVVFASACGGSTSGGPSAGGSAGGGMNGGADNSAGASGNGGSASDGGSGNGGSSSNGGSGNGRGGNGGNSSNGGGGVADVDGSIGGSPNTGGDNGSDAGRSVDASQICPIQAPTVGTSCSPPGLRCVYGDICCGGGRQCTQAGQWEVIPVGCACIMRPDAAADGGTMCGDQTCTSNQVCVHPSTSRGGPVPPCVAQPDAGRCPPGTELTAFCAGSPNGGCIETFVPGPPSCAPIPSTCGNPLQCSCFPVSICGGNANLCSTIDGHDLRCVNLAP